MFRRITFSPLDISKQFFSGNADEIHIIGLTGKLLIENCCFENLGDDVINAHTQVINCRNIKQDSAEVYFNKVGGFVSPYWAKRGDTIRVYDSKTLKRKTDLIFSDFKDNVLYFKNSADLDINDYLVNDIYYPDNDLHHNNIHIHDNVFENIMLQPLTLSNCDNVRIHDNAFIGCKYPCNTAENSN